LNSQPVKKHIAISSTYFPPKHTYKRTCSATDSSNFNQIGHILIDKRFANSTLDVSSFQGGRTDSDHHLDQVKYGCKTNNKESMQ
jgi:hypothetical protein